MHPHSRGIWVSLAATLLAPVLPGCCDEGEAPSPPESRPAASSSSPVVSGANPESACDQVSAAFCKKYFACGARRPEGYRDVVTCRAAIKQGCLADHTLPGTVPAGRPACLDALNKLPCTETRRGLPLPCSRRGILDPGAACLRGAQCTSGDCEVPAGQNCGRCASRGELGEGCGGPNEPPGCVRGLSCVRGECAPRTKLGADCDRDKRVCDPEYTCVGLMKNDQLRGKCVADMQKAGEKCQFEPQGEAMFKHPECMPGLVCAQPGASGSICVEPHFIKAGSPWTLGKGEYGIPLPTFCEPGSHRVEGPGDVERCAKHALAGESCGRDGWCVPPFVCHEGTCKGPDPKLCT